MLRGGSSSNDRLVQLINGVRFGYDDSIVFQLWLARLVFCHIKMGDKSLGEDAPHGSHAAAVGKRTLRHHQFRRVSVGCRSGVSLVAGDCANVVTHRNKKVCKIHRQQDVIHDDDDTQAIRHETWPKAQTPRTHAPMVLHLALVAGPRGAYRILVRSWPSMTAKN